MLTIITTDVIKFMIIVELLNSDPSLKDFILRIHSHEGVKGRVTLLQTPLHPLPLPDARLLAAPDLISAVHAKNLFTT